MYLWPVASRKITSRYGKRIHPVTQIETFHNGVDIACPVGSVVSSPCQGVVLSVWNDTTFGGGLSLIIEDPKTETRFGFAHLSRVEVSEGSQVQRGKRVALTGGAPGAPGAGKSTGPHLHFTVRVKLKRHNPMGFPWEYQDK